MAAPPEAEPPHRAAVDQELLPTNPAVGIKLPSPPPAVERFLTRAEYSAIREQLPTARDQAIADSLVSTGVRWGEATGAHEARLDRRRGVLQVVEAWAEQAGKMKAHPKGRRIRDVPVPSWLLDTWHDLSRDSTVKSCGYEHAGVRCRSGLLLATATGSVLYSSNWRRVWDGAVTGAGVGHVRPHDLRHTHASWLLQDGVSLAEVGRLLGPRLAGDDAAVRVAGEGAVRGGVEGARRGVCPTSAPRWRRGLEPRI